MMLPHCDRCKHAIDETRSCRTWIEIAEGIFHVNVNHHKDGFHLCRPCYVQILEKMIAAVREDAKSPQTIMSDGRCVTLCFDKHLSGALCVKEKHHGHATGDWTHTDGVAKW